MSILLASVSLHDTVQASMYLHQVSDVKPQRPVMAVTQVQVASTGVYPPRCVFRYQGATFGQALSWPRPREWLRLVSTPSLNSPGWFMGKCRGKSGSTQQIMGMS